MVRCDERAKPCSENASKGEMVQTSKHEMHTAIYVLQYVETYLFIIGRSE
jgi:hypothetical protein